MSRRIPSLSAIALLIASAALSLGANAAGSRVGASRPAETLALTAVEKRLAWRDLHGQAVHYCGVPWFETIDRWIIPNTVTTTRVTRRAIRDVLALAPYDFGIMEGQLLIVNPADRTIAAVIRPYRRVDECAGQR